MISSYTLFVDLDRCWGCGTCEVACALEKDAGPGTALINVVRIDEAGKNDGKNTGLFLRSFIPVLCLQCDNPVCVESCPSGAILKDLNGIVRIDAESCVACGACGACEEACPYGAIHLDPKSGKARKCDLCLDRLETGRLPACAQHCPGRAITIYPPEPEEAVLGSGAKMSWSRGKVTYLSRTRVQGC
jgi:Fe-S-cluster-containing dehydrogenase component